MIRYQVEGREFTDGDAAEAYAMALAQREGRNVSLMEKTDDLSPWARVATYAPTED